MLYLYVYVENDKVEDAKKYGMKLSDYANKVITLNQEKKGIDAYLVPKDSDLYKNKNYTCLKIYPQNLNIWIYNKICENYDIMSKFFCSFESYSIGTFEDPMALICSTILPENISIYNKLRDSPVLIENSKEFFYEKSINEMLDSGKFTNYELYQMLLILGEKKKLFKVLNKDEKLKVYKNKYDSRLYTKKSSF